jgi:hypothetical protein
MNNDYASIVTTLDVAVLLVGAVQFATIYKRFADQSAAAVHSVREKKGRLIEALRRGEEPDRVQLLDARPSSLRMVLQTWHLALAIIVWCILDAFLIQVQLGVLEWAGTKNAGPDPALAQKAAIVTAVGVFVVFIEGMFRALWTALHGLRENKRTYVERYTDAEREAVEERIRQAVVQTPAPDPAQASS